VGGGGIEVVDAVAAEESDGAIDRLGAGSPHAAANHATASAMPIRPNFDDLRAFIAWRTHPSPIA
jgi:hypothetical protein